MRKLILHVGVHRTGTTSTQKFMRENFQPLLKKGCLYPFGVARHDRVVRRLLRNEVPAIKLARDLERRAASHPSHVHTVVLSDEDMSMIPDFRVFEPLKETFDVKIVMSLRRQDLWLESWYLQNVKWQWNPALAHLTFDQFFARRADFFWIDYAARFAHFEAVFGPGSVIAGVFEKADMPDGPIQAFLRMIGIEDMSGFSPFLHSNSSLSPLMSEMLRQMPMDKMAPKERALVEAACIEVDRNLVTNGSKLVMPFEQRQLVLGEYADSNRQVAQKNFNRDVLFHEPVPLESDALAELSLPGNSQDLVRLFMAPIFRELADLMAAARMERESKTTDLWERRTAWRSADAVEQDFS